MAYTLKPQKRAIWMEQLWQLKNQLEELRQQAYRDNQFSISASLSQFEAEIRRLRFKISDQPPDDPA